MDAEVMQAIEERNIEIEQLKNRLNNEKLNAREVKRIEKQITKLEKMNKKSEFWGNLATKTEETGNQLKNTGKSMTKVGLKTTAITWTPAIYLGYKGVKKIKEKNSTPESDLVSLVKECEQAYKDGKIDEDTMKEYITDFVNNYYRK
ncbi:hypothetical protein ACDI16_02195 [Oceanobacillus caeni]